ncbi:hypothetical protein MNV84_01762 [Leishmania braziliensis]|nr:hypothetical protein MNV84_01762 [Leishmania braziliensis]
MKSARTTAKVRPGRLPYSTTVRRGRHARSLLSRVAHGVRAVMAKANFLRRLPSLEAHGALGLTESPLSSSSSVTPPALAPGDILRDLAFFTQASEVSFFSTHPSLCADVFGVAPGEVFEVGDSRASTSSGRVEGEASSSTAGEVIVVVGARGGKLWVWAYSDAYARVLRVPALTISATSLNATEVRAAIVAHHQLRELVNPSRAQHSTAGRKVRDQSAQVGLIKNVCAAFQSLCARACEEAGRLYTPDQQAFLQCAPDLYVAATRGADWAASPSAATSPAAGVNSEPQQQQPDHPPELYLPSFLLNSIYTDIARHAPHTATVVLLVPRVALATGAVGWAGEGDVLLTDTPVGQGGYGEASLSASVVI